MMLMYSLPNIVAKKCSIRQAFLHCQQPIVDYDFHMNGIAKLLHFKYANKF